MTLIGIYMIIGVIMMQQINNFKDFCKFFKFSLNFFEILTILKYQN